MASVSLSATRELPAFPFRSLESGAEAPDAGRRGSLFLVSVVLHALLILAVVAVPLYFYDAVPAANERVLRAVFVSAPRVDVPPPPPPPPPAAAALRPRSPSVVPVPAAPAAFVAPLEVPVRFVAEPVDFGVALGGVPGGVEGGVPGGVVGGIVGGLPREAPAPPPVEVVRVGGALSAPERVHFVRPEYPEIARMAKLSGLVILDARIGVDGRVEQMNLLRGVPVLNEAVLAAVSQWRYRPLLLNGVPTPFILTLTVSYGLRGPVS